MWLHTEPSPPCPPIPGDGQGQAAKKATYVPERFLALSFIALLIFLLFCPSLFQTQALCTGESGLGGGAWLF